VKKVEIIGKARKGTPTWFVPQNEGAPQVREERLPSQGIPVRTKRGGWLWVNLPSCKRKGDQNGFFKAIREKRTRKSCSSGKRGRGKNVRQDGSEQV